MVMVMLGGLMSVWNHEYECIWSDMLMSNRSADVSQEVEREGRRKRLRKCQTSVITSEKDVTLTPQPQIAEDLPSAFMWLTDAGS